MQRRFDLLFGVSLIALSLSGLLAIPSDTPASGFARVAFAVLGVFATIMTELAARAQNTEMVMIDAPHLKTHRTASSLAVQKWGEERLIGRTKGGLNSKLHVLADAKGRPIHMFLSACALAAIVIYWL